MAHEEPSQSQLHWLLPIPSIPLLFRRRESYSSVRSLTVAAVSQVLAHELSHHILEHSEERAVLMAQLAGLQVTNALTCYPQRVFPPPWSLSDPPGVYF